MARHQIATLFLEDFEDIAFEWRPSRRIGLAPAGPCGPVGVEDIVARKLAGDRTAPTMPHYDPVFSPETR